MMMVYCEVDWVELCCLIFGCMVVKWVMSIDYKVIGNLYFIILFVWFFIGGLLVLLIWVELFKLGL